MQTPNPKKINLLDYDRNALGAWLVEQGEKPFRARQIFQWIHQHGVIDFSAMTSLSKVLRAKLSELTEVVPPKIGSESVASDGTIKWLMKLSDGNAVETVFIPEKNRGTLCISSQVGCALDCSFCSTGKQGFNRNLTVAEIIGQVWVASRRLTPPFPTTERSVTNVVLMGMGEPLLNLDNVVSAMDMMLDDLGYNLSKYRVTLSTSGLIPAMLELKQRIPVALAVSLHAPNNTLRNELVPINKKYSLEQLIPVCRDYFVDEPRREVTFEYVMLEGINDQVHHAQELVELLKGVRCKVNLIPFNPFPMVQYKRSSEKNILRFQSILAAARIQTNVRRTRGDDIDAACGQLVGDVDDRTNRSAKWAKKIQMAVEVEYDQVA